MPLLSRLSRACASAALVFLAAGPAPAADAPLAWSGARQMVLVTVDDWNVDHGTLRTYERDGKAWRETGKPAPVTIGKNGAAWGLGLHDAQTGGPVKKEGDDRSPAGVFRIGLAFGYADKSLTAMPYRALQVSDYCVDVSGSPLYNQIVDTRKVGEQAVAGATEPMRRDLHFDGDHAYRIGFVIEHNAGGQKAAGSCIFAHLWKTPTTPTAGCTAMTDEAMERLLAWLDPKKKPVFVLLPKDQYARLRTSWKLPAP
jgi:L,D-peptidoglycan transpeptidase YkuD (ErfK/YbiS/YcfS/YnhG family)